MITVEIPLFGTYQSDNDLYQAALELGRRELLDRVRAVVSDSEFSHAAVELLNCELAAMVAEWDTGARTNEREAEKAAPHVRPVPAARPTGSVVVNLTDLTPTMRRGLLSIDSGENNVPTATRRGLHRRGMLTTSAGPLELTESGRRATEAIRAEVNAAPIVPVLPAINPRLLSDHGHDRHCREHSHAYGFLASSVEQFLTGRATAEQLRADLARTATCLADAFTEATGQPAASDLQAWAGVTR